jgi:hypothetical protein
VSSQRLRACLMAAATAAVLTACGRDADDRTDPLGYEDGIAPAEPVSTLEALAIYLLIPLAIIVVVAALAWLPTMVRSKRYRPGRGWDAAPLWFGGPPDPAAAVENAEPGDLVRGGASGDW